MDGFTHLDHEGNAIMVDVSGKSTTVRQAVAQGRIWMSEGCYGAVRGGKAKKGDVLGVARIAGIMAAKQTAALIPLCHTIPIEKVQIAFSFDDESRAVTGLCTVKTTGMTGVEMEALTGISVAMLTLYDMCKAMDKTMVIGDICLLEKTGGKSGTFRRDESEDENHG